MGLMTDTYSKVRAQFGKSAEGYVHSEGHAKGAELALMVELAGDVSGARVLDIATGGGHTALAFARAGADVVATDLTPEMLRAAEASSKEEAAEVRASVSPSPLPPPKTSLLGALPSTSLRAASPRTTSRTLQRFLKRAQGCLNLVDASCSLTTSRRRRASWRGL